MTATGPGLYGKLPARGDFVQRQLPSAFVEPWDDWLQAALAASQAALEQSWLPNYLNSPIWRFALSAGCCGEAPVAGLMMPSVDRVGRYFPLTLACLLDPGADITGLLRYGDAWYAGAEQLLLEALADELDLDALYQRLGVVGAPPGLPSGPDVPKGEHWHLALDGLARLANNLDRLTPLLLAQAFPRVSMWWSHGSRQIEPCLLVSAGLPAANAFAGLLAGNWARYDWIVVPDAVAGPAAAVDEGER